MLQPPLDTGSSACKIWGQEARASTPHLEQMTFTTTQILIATEFKAISQILTSTRQSDGKIYDAALCRYNSLACAGLIPCHWSEIVGW